MRKKILLLVFGMVVAQTLFGQERTLILGKVVMDSVGIQDVHIINLSSRRGTLSNDRGVFEMEVAVSDTLQFSDIQFETKSISITQKDLDKGILLVELKYKIEMLEEIFVKNKDDFLKVKDTPDVLVNSVSLQLPNAGKPKLTYVDRKVNYYQKGGSVDKIYGWLSGQTKQLKKLKKDLKDDEILEQIRIYLTDRYFVTLLEIEEVGINQFLNYCKKEHIVRQYKNDQFSLLLETLEKCKMNFPEN